MTMGYNPLDRWARLNAMIEELRSHNWDVTDSLTRVATSDEPEPETVDVEALREAEG